MSKPRKAPKPPGRKPRARAPEPEASPLDARALKLLLQATGMSQVELAARSGVNPKTVSRVVTARTALTAETAEKLTQGLDLPVDFLANTRDFLVEIDKLRTLHASPGRVGEGGEPEERGGADDNVAEASEQALERRRYLEARRVVESATRAFRDLAMWMATHDAGLPHDDR